MLIPRPLYTELDPPRAASLMRTPRRPTDAIDEHASVKHDIGMEVRETDLREVIKSTLGDSVPVERIYLFGSRARGAFRMDSDVDLLVVVAGHYSCRGRVQMATKIRRILAKRSIDADVLVVSPGEISAYADKRGSVIHEALKEGIAI